jgi:hypothetical protein
MADFLPIFAGVYLIVTGLSNRPFITESDIPATKEEREKAKPTLFGRLLVVGAGIGSLLYGVLHLLMHRSK